MKTLSFLAILLCGSTGALAQIAPEHLTDLTLEQLYELDAITVNVLGAHTHYEGEWMLGYRYQLRRLAGNLERRSRARRGEILQAFSYTPTRMRVETHRAELMHAPSDDLTLLAVLPYLRKSMDHQARTGVRFTFDAEGPGDVILAGNYVFFRDDEEINRLHLGLGVSLPTGSIGERDDMPAGENRRLPYPMQLGSGTFDLLPSLTYLGEGKDWSWGGQAMATVRLGRNRRDYTLGNRLQLSGWGVRRLRDWLSTSVRLEGQIWGNVRGADRALDPTAVPTADPDRRAGTRVDLLVGVNLYAPAGVLEGHRLALEAGLPIFESLDGPQLQTDWQATLTWSWTF